MNIAFSAKLYKCLTVLLAALLALTACGGALAGAASASAAIDLTGHVSFNAACNASGIADPGSVTELTITGKTTRGAWTAGDRIILSSKFTALQTLDMKGYTGTYENGAFQSSGFSQVRLPANAPISEGMFNRCASLTTLAVGDRPLTPGVIDLTGYTAGGYGKNSFGASGVSQVRLPADAPIGEGMFNRCVSLTTLAVGDRPFTPGVIDLTGYMASGYGDNAFFFSGVSQVRLPADVAIGEGMFWLCAWLDTLAVGSQPFTPGVIDLTGYTAGSYGTMAFRASEIITKAHLPANVPLSQSMFADCSSLATLSFTGGNAPAVGLYAFDGIPNNASCTLYYPAGAAGYGVSEFDPDNLNHWRRVAVTPAPMPAPPKTGDGAQPLLWLALGVLALAGAAGLAMWNKKRQQAHS